MFEPNEYENIMKALTYLTEVVEKKHALSPDRVMSRKEAAKFLGISTDTLRRKIKSGEYPSKIMHGKGRSKRFFASELEALIKKS